MSVSIVLRSPAPTSGGLQLNALAAAKIWNCANTTLLHRHDGPAMKRKRYIQIMFLLLWKKPYLNITFPFHGEPLESRTSNHYLSATNGVRINEEASVDLNLQ